MTQTHSHSVAASLKFMLLCTGSFVIATTAGAHARVQDSDALRDRLVEVDRQIETGPKRPARGASIAVAYAEHMPLRDADRYRDWLGVEDVAYRQWLTDHFAAYQQRVLRLQSDLLVEAMQLASELADEPGRNHTIETYTPLIERFYSDLILAYDRRLESAEMDAIAMLYASLPEAEREGAVLGLIEADRHRLRYQKPCMVPMSTTDLIAVLGQMNVDAFDAPELRELAEAYVLEIGPGRRTRYRDEMRTSLAEKKLLQQRAGDPSLDLIAARRSMRGPYVNACMRLVRVNQQYIDQFGNVLDKTQHEELMRRVREQAFGAQVYDPNVEHRIRIFTEHVRETLELDDKQRAVVDQFIDEFELWYDEHQRKIERYIIDHTQHMYRTLSMSQPDMIAHQAKLADMKAEVSRRFQTMSSEVDAFLERSR